MISKDKLSYYQYLVTHLRRDYKKGGAPHKPVLLLSIIEAYQKKQIQDNRIYITPELVGLFKDNWNAFVQTEHDLKFALPFYHLRSEPFWKLIPKPGCEMLLEIAGSMRSFSNLNMAVAYAEIDIELFELFHDNIAAELLRRCIVETYFPQFTDVIAKEGSLEIRENQILEESPEQYKQTIKSLQASLDRDAYQEEIFLRGGAFKRQIPKIYNDSCCISGLRIDLAANVSMIDACHIVPFSESYDDTITNGIALCPNLHRAFDRGLIAIDDNFKVLVRPDFVENTKSSYTIRQFNGVTINLPAESKNHPRLENLYLHRRKFGFEKTKVML